MSSNVSSNYFYQIKGRKLRLYRYLHSDSTINSQGEISSGAELIYPDEAITNGLGLNIEDYMNLL